MHHGNVGDSHAGSIESTVPWKIVIVSSTFSPATAELMASSTMEIANSLFYIMPTTKRSSTITGQKQVIQVTKVA